jgi:LysM repeat protein
MIHPMTDRGLPIVDGAPACPFVAFEDDRDARATAPDHRHRCFAEVRPAPRALAHQEAYCLSPAFPVCPTFQDWARREAAQARAAAAPPTAGSADDPSGAPADRPDRGTGTVGPLHRNPPRDWAAPPPWVAETPDDDMDEAPEVRAQPPVRGGGLSGSFADRLVTEARGTQGAAPPAGRDGRRLGYEDERDGADDDGLEAAEPSRATAGTSAADRQRAAAAPSAAPAARDRPAGRKAGPVGPARAPGPPWERPRRIEAYPTLKTRLGLPALSLPPILVGVAAVAIAAVALFFLPTLLGVGNPPAGDGSPSPTVEASVGPSGTPSAPTAVPGPTSQVYTVVSGDTMSKIAARFGVPLQVLISANAANVPNPDVLVPGQELVIPNLAPTSLPDAGSFTEAPSTAP